MNYIYPLPWEVVCRDENYVYSNYKISQNGVVTSLRSNKALNLNLSKGYYRVRLTKHPGYGRYVIINRLMLLSFYSIPKNVYELHARHLDGNSKNNLLENLSWGTAKENAQDSIRHGTHTSLQKRNTELTAARGEKQGSSYLTEKEVLLIRELYSTGNYSQRELARKFCVAQKSIWNVVNQKLWTHI